MSLGAEEAFRIVERTAQMTHLYRGERSSRGKAQVHFADYVKKGDLKDIMKDAFREMQVHQGSSKRPVVAQVCGVCSSTMHMDNSCPHNSARGEDEGYENVNYMGSGNVTQASNTYNPNLRNHPNFSYKNQEPMPFNNRNTNSSGYPPRNQNQSQGAYQIPQYRNEHKGNYHSGEGYQRNQHHDQHRNYQRDNRPHHGNQEDSEVDKLAKVVEQLMAHQNMLSTQIAQIAQSQASSSNRSPGKLPSQPDAHPTEDCNAILVRSDLDFEKGDWTPFEDDEVEMVTFSFKLESENVFEEVHGITLKSGKTYESPTPKLIVPSAPKEVEEKKDEVEVVKGSEEIIEDARIAPTKEPYVAPPPYMPPVPFPQRLKKNKGDVEFGKFLKIMKQLMVNIPFLDFLKDAPMYVKFVKEILSNKRTIEDIGSCLLSHECSALISSIVPTKVKDPGRFTIPCSIGNVYFDRPLADLGASVSVMPIEVYRNLGLDGMRPTEMILHLADGTSKKPQGVIENVPVKIDRFYVPCDFVVMDVSSQVNPQLIFGRPFLATARANIEVATGRLTLEIFDEVVVIQPAVKLEVTLGDKVKSLEIEEPANEVMIIEAVERVKSSKAKKRRRRRLKRLCGPPPSSSCEAQLVESFSKGSSGLSKPKNLRKKNNGTSNAIKGAAMLASKNPD